VTVWGFTDDPSLTPAVSRHVARTLRQLGFQARLHVVTHRDLERAPPAVFDAIQLIPAGWVPDYPSANAMLALWFRCDGAYNHGYYCRPGLDRMMDRAAELQTAEPRRAARLWSKVDARLVAEAAWLPLVNPRATDFLSKRVHNYQRHAIWGVLADQLWMR